GADADRSLGGLVEAADELRLAWAAAGETSAGDVTKQLHEVGGCKVEEILLRCRRLDRAAAVVAMVDGRGLAGDLVDEGRGHVLDLREERQPVRIAEGDDDAHGVSPAGWCRSRRGWQSGRPSERRADRPGPGDRRSVP